MFREYCCVDRITVVRSAYQRYEVIDDAFRNAVVFCHYMHIYTQTLGLLARHIVAWKGSAAVYALRRPLYWHRFI